MELFQPQREISEVPSDDRSRTGEATESQAEELAMAVKVSVIIPVYNAEKTIERAIGSVFHQQFESKEIIAVDDGSKDSSFSVLERYADKIAISWQRNRGAAAARNAGASLAAGDYLAFLDADDEWLPHKLRASVDALDGSPRAVVAYSDVISGDGFKLRPMSGSPSLDYLLSNPFGLFPSATAVRRQAFEKCGGFPEQFSGAGFEDAFAALLLREQGEFVHIAEPLVVYHGAAASILASKYRRGYRVFRRLVKERYGIRGRGIRLAMRRYYGSLLFGAALESMREKRLASAILNLARATTTSPIHVLGRVLRRSGGLGSLRT